MTSGVCAAACCRGAGAYLSTLHPGALGQWLERGHGGDTDIPETDRQARSTPPGGRPTAHRTPPAAHLPYGHTEPQKRDGIRARPHGAPWGRHLPQLHVLPSVGLIGLLHVRELKVERLRLGDLSGPGQVLHQGHELVVVPAVVVEFCRESVGHLYQTLSYAARRGGSQLQEPPANTQSPQSGLWLPRFLPCPCAAAQNPTRSCSRAPGSTRGGHTRGPRSKCHSSLNILKTTNFGKHIRSSSVTSSS